MSKIHIYSNGIVHCSVCVPAEMSKEEIETEVNRENPTGIESRWKVDETPRFASGDPNPKECETDSTRKHYLMVC